LASARLRLARHILARTSPPGPLSPRHDEGGAWGRSMRSGCPEALQRPGSRRTGDWPAHRSGPPGGLRLHTGSSIRALAGDEVGFSRGSHSATQAHGRRGGRPDPSAADNQWVLQGRRQASPMQRIDTLAPVLAVPASKDWPRRRRTFGLDTPRHLRRSKDLSRPNINASKVGKADSAPGCSFTRPRVDSSRHDARMFEISRRTENMLKKRYAS
jgi:hypothetical protein